MKKVFDSSAVDLEGNACPLTRAVAKGAPVELDWELVDELHYIGLEEYLDVERIGALLVWG